jgi:hypothetical protein
MKGKGTKAEPKPAPALVPIPSDEEDMLADDGPINGKVSPLPVEEEAEAKVAETMPLGLDDKEIIDAEDEPLLEHLPIPPVESEPLPLKSQAVQLEIESLPPPAVSQANGLVEVQTEKAIEPLQASECILGMEEPNPFVVNEERAIAVAAGDGPTRTPSPADVAMEDIGEQHIEYLVPLADSVSAEPAQPEQHSVDHEAPLEASQPVGESTDLAEPPGPNPLAMGKAKALGKKRAPSVIPTGGRVTRSSSTRDADTSMPTKPTTKAPGWSHCLAAHVYRSRVSVSHSSREDETDYH